MKFANDNKLDRKSGVAQWRDLRFLSLTLGPEETRIIPCATPGFAGPYRKSCGWASPGFPVELGGFGAPHAAFLTESRTRGRVQRSAQEIRVAHLFRPTYARANVGHPSPVLLLLGSAETVTRPKPHHSVRKAWTGLMEAARWAGITLATSAQNPKAAMEPASTSGSQLFTW
jgi:hypothetical protein